MKRKIINLFVSHYGGDEDKIEPLKELLRNKGYVIRDDSVKESEPNNASAPDYIKSQILGPRIKWAGCIVVLIGPKTASREWVDWEINYAEKQGKRIIGVFLQGAKDSDVPEALESYGSALVGWNSNKIADAIEGENIWVKADGTNRPENYTSRVTC